MGDCLQAGKPSWYVASHPLTLAIPSCVGAISTSESLDETGTPHDALAPYSWSGSVNWCLAEG